MSEFDRFTSRALRGPKNGIFEQSLCQHLSLAVSSQPLKKIRYICEACLLLDPKTAGKIATEYYNVSWGFKKNRENHNKYIQPWMQGRNFYYYPNLLPRGSKQKIVREEIKNGIQENKKHTRAKSLSDVERKREIEKIRDGLNGLRADWFFMASTCLTTSSFYDIRNCFVSWALPKAQRIFAQLTSLVTPQTFWQFFKAEKEEGEGEKAGGPLGPRE